MKLWSLDLISLIIGYRIMLDQKGSRREYASMGRLRFQNFINCQKQDVRLCPNRARQ